MLSRRNFLIVGSAASAITLARSGAAHAAITPGDRYDVAITAIKDLDATKFPSRNPAVDRACFEAFRAIDDFDVDLQLYAMEPRDSADLDVETAEKLASLPEADHRLLRAAIDAEAAVFAMNRPWIQGPLFTEWCRKADAFLGQLLLDFQEMPTPAMASDLYAKRIRVDALDSDSLRTLVPAIAPLALAHECVAHLHLPFSMTRLTNFRAYAERYREVIMADA